MIVIQQHASNTSTDSLSHTCSLDLQKLNQLQHQNENITKLSAKCKSGKNNESPYHLDEHGIIYRKIRDGPNSFHASMVPKTLQPYIFYECHNALKHYGSTRLHNFLRRNYYWEKLCQICNKYVCSCTEFNS